VVIPVVIPVAIPAVTPDTVPDVHVELPYIELAVPAFASFASSRPDLIPVVSRSVGDVYLSVKQPANEVVAVPITPITTPVVTPPLPYIRPVYAPKPARN
jgi:hypothetical protein